jgi:peptidoglycan/LPS O-acetylase OafA/YrhL
MLHTRIDTLMFGCAAALLSGDPRLASVMRTGYRRMLGIGIVAAVLSPILTARLGGAYLYLIGYTVEGACIVLLMVWLTENPKSGAGVFLNTRVLVHIGVLSYSIYLWQQIFLASDNRTWTGQFPLNLLLAFSAAEISYQLVEKSFLRWRSRLRHTGRPSQKTEAIAQGELPLPQ